MMGAIEEYRARNAARDARSAAKQKPPEERKWWFNQPIPIDRFTGWLVAWTALLFLATVGNVIVINKTDEKIGTQLEEIQRQSKSIERSSTQGRAYVFVSLLSPNSVDQQLPGVGTSATALTLNFAIENFGQTPAVITSFETHILAPKGSIYFPDNEPPKPDSPAFVASKEDFLQPAFSEDAHLIFDEHFHAPTVIPANSKRILMKRTFFFGRPVQHHGAWFYCAIKYKDIFGFDRETVYYVGMFGAAVELPKNDTYNYWN
jgi:hypothetical protein